MKIGQMLIVYNSFISSNFSYRPLAWNFCSASSTNKLVKIQERAFRFINNGHTSTLNTLLKSTNTQPLHVRRLKQMACEVFKFVNYMSPDYINDLVKIKHQITISGKEGRQMSTELTQQGMD